jgi:hypothetical protein|tara:strand:+ start:1931 stop:2200 length:270 start_codon:yes stop_codon:yes gene_type:complete
MKKLKDKVDDGFNYFHSGILEELTTDKKFYVQAFMDYIEYLESRKYLNQTLAEEVKAKTIIPTKCIECNNINTHDTDSFGFCTECLGHL